MTRKRRSPAEAFAYFREQVEARGGQVVEPTWLGSRTHHRVICRAGHQTTAIPNALQQGGGFCRTCVGQDPAASWQRFREHVESLGGVVLEERWLGSMTPHRIRCPEGHEASPLPSNVTNGRQGICRTCYQPTPEMAWRAFRERVEARGGRVLATEWRGVNRPHLVECGRGHRHSIHPSRVREHEGMCRTCAGQDEATLFREFIERVTRLGGAVLEPEWLGALKYHRVRCRFGHDSRAYPKLVARGRGICHVCAGKVWDVLYVVTSPLGSVKFGITAGDPRPRLADHRRAGFDTVVRLRSAFPEAAALERELLATLRLAEIAPVRGREYYDSSALPVILDVVDHWAASDPEGTNGSPDSDPPAAA